MNTTPYSDEQLNAFVDNELEPRERLEILQTAVGSELLRNQLLQRQYLKELNRAAFPLDEQPRRPHRRTPSRPRGHYLAAAAIGGLALFAVQLMTTSDPDGRTPLVTLSKPTQAQQTRVVFHISSDNHTDGEQLLDQVELVLREYQANGRPLRLEVVANNQGLRLMQQGRSPFSERIHHLSETYPNLVFAACGSTLERLIQETGEQIRILPEALIVRSGVSYITRRQQTGWAYIKV